MTKPWSIEAELARMDDLLNRIRARLPDLEAMAVELKDAEEDGVYRFYYQSFRCSTFRPT